MAELGNDWYLDRIEVTGPEGVRWRFPCNAWLGRQEGDNYAGALQGSPYLWLACCANSVEVCDVKASGTFTSSRSAKLTLC